MTDHTTPGVPTSRRSLAIEGLMGLAQELLVARFILARALAQLDTHDVLNLLDEVDETIAGRSVPALEFEDGRPRVVPVEPT